VGSFTRKKTTRDQKQFSYSIAKQGDSQSELSEATTPIVVKPV